MPSKIFAIFAIPATIIFLFFVVVGLLLWWPIALLAPVAAALVVWAMWRRSDRAMLTKLDARPLGEREGERILNTVENLCLTSGIDQPDVYAIDSNAVNLVALSGVNNSLVATTGLLESFDALEMEGVVAHGLSKLSSGAIAYETLAASAEPFLTGVQREWVRQWGTGDAGVIAFDISGVGLTRYPPGLRSALERIDGRSTDIEGAVALGSALLVPPASQRIPLDHRIEILWEL